MSDGKAATENVLSHYGVKGMKWGIRRTAAQLARSAGNKTASVIDDKRSEDAKAMADVISRVGKGGDLSRLSNSEIQALSNRIRMEQEYARLTTNNTPAGASRLAKGKAFATSLAADIAKEQTRRIAKEYAKDKVDAAALKRGLDLNKKETQKAREKAEKVAKEAADKATQAAKEAAKNAKSGKKSDPIPMVLGEDGIWRPDV